MSVWGYVIAGGVAGGLATGFVLRALGSDDSQKLAERAARAEQERDSARRRAQALEREQNALRDELASLQNANYGLHERIEGLERALARAEQIAKRRLRQVRRLKGKE